VSEEVDWEQLVRAHSKERLKLCVVLPAPTTPSGAIGQPNVLERLKVLDQDGRLLLTGTGVELSAKTNEFTEVTLRFIPDKVIFE
jgi:hypothetical protein